MWANIKRLCGLHPTIHIHAIYNPLTQDTYTCPSEIANIFGELWSQEAKDTNFSNSFRTNKLLLNTLINFISSQAANQIENDISYIEMLSALNSLKGSTPGMDRISYSMIKNSPPSFKIRILNHFNNILSSHVPQAYIVSLVLPTIKPEKPQIEPESYLDKTYILKPMHSQNIRQNYCEKVVVVCSNELTYSQQRVRIQKR